MPEIEIEMEESNSNPLQGALLIYGNGTFMTYATFNGKELVNPKIIDKNAIAQLCQNVLDQNVTWTDEYILAIGINNYTWWTPIQTRVMYFKTTDEYLNDLSGKTFSQPALVWNINNNRLKVWALADNIRPSKTSQLYKAPYLNIDASGLVCLGSTEIPKVITSESLLAISNSFYDSKFTHTNHQFITTQGTYGEFLETIQHSEIFPSQALNTVNQTLKHAIN